MASQCSTRRVARGSASRLRSRWQAGGGLRLHEVHRHAEVVGLHGEGDRDGIDAPIGMDGAEDPVVVRHEAGAGVVLVEPHRGRG